MTRLIKNKVKTTAARPCLLGCMRLLYESFVSRVFSKNITEHNASKAQIELLRFMEYLSEEYMCASWMNGLDESLHGALYKKTGCSSFFERDPISRKDFNKLRELHLSVKGWWRFIDDAPPESEMVFLRLGKGYSAEEDRNEPLRYEDLEDVPYIKKEIKTKPLSLSPSLKKIADRIIETGVEKIYFGRNEYYELKRQFIAFASGSALYRENTLQENFIFKGATIICKTI